MANQRRDPKANGNDSRRRPSLAARLSRIPRGLVLVVVVMLALGTLLAPGWIGALLVLLLDAALVTLLLATWARLTILDRAIRLIVIGAFVLIALGKLGLGPWA